MLLSLYNYKLIVIQLLEMLRDIVFKSFIILILKEIKQLSVNCLNSPELNIYIEKSLFNSNMTLQTKLRCLLNLIFKELWDN